MFKKPDSSRFTPTDAIFVHLETLREYRQRSARGRKMPKFDQLTRVFEQTLAQQPPELLVAAINDILHTLSGHDPSTEELELLARALNSTFGLKPDLMSDEPEE